MELLAIALITLTGAGVLAARARARGLPPTNYAVLAIGLSAAGAVTFALLTIPLSCGLWGFNRPPDWEQYFMSGAAVVGTICGVLSAYFIAFRTDRQRIRDRQEAEADYDEPERSDPAPPP